MLKNYVSLDVETANNFRRSICSIGIAKFQNGELVDTFYSLVNPEEEFGWRQTKIHGITATDVENSPTFSELQGEIQDFILDLPIVAHNASFDSSAIRKASEKYNLPLIENKWYCSKRIAEKSLPNELSYGLEFLAYKFSIKLDHHNALSDTIACGLLLSKLPPISESAYASFTSKSTTVEQIDDNLSGCHFCFTGTLQAFTKDEAGDAVVSHGGIYQRNITKQTNYLVVGQFRPAQLESGGSGKIKKTYDLLNAGQKIEILTEAEFLQMI